MGYDKEREQVKAVYTNQTWRDKVNRMSDGQVFALWKKFRDENKLK